MSQDERDRFHQSMRVSAIEPLDRGMSPRSQRRRFAMSRRWWLIVFTLIVCGVFFGEWLRRHWHHEIVVAFDRRCYEMSNGSRWEDLAKVSEQWSNVEPLKAEPWLFRAEAAENLKEWPDLVQYLDRVPRNDRRSIGALVRKAAAEFEYLNRPWDGVKTCDEVLQLDQRVLLAHKQLIFFNAVTLQRAEMVRRIRQAIRVRRESPESYAYLLSASWLYSGSIYSQNTRWLESDPDNEIFQVARALHVYANESKSDLEAAAEFEHIPPEEEMLEKYPHNLELVAFFLNRSITDGDLERVQSLLRAVPPALADVDSRYWKARAWCEDTLGDFESSENSLRRAFELDPYWWKVHFQLHDLLRRRGRLEESAKFFAMTKISKELSAEIRALKRSMADLDGEKFCRSMLELVELIGDDEVAFALRERFLSP